ncbi:Cytochrome P450 709B2 [Seiridium cupressi]
MDVLTCVGLATLEVATARGIGITTSFATSQVILIVFILHYFAIKYYRTYLYPKHFSPWRHLPTPQASRSFTAATSLRKLLLTLSQDNQFLVGQAIKIFKADTPVSVFVKWMEQNPDAPFIRYLTFGNGEMLLVNSPSAHREVLQANCYSFKKPDRFRRMIKQFAGEKSLAMLEFGEHRQHRKMLAGVFTPANIRRLAPVFAAKAKEMHDLFDQAIASHDGKTGIIDCAHTYSKATLDAVGIAIFGVDLVQTKNSAISGKLNDQYSFADAYEDLFAMDATGKVLLLLNSFIPIRWLPLKANRQFLFAINWLDETLIGLVRDRRREISEAIAAGKYDKQSRDLLSFLVEESLPGGAAAGISDKHIADHLLVFMGAGHDSSADMASWSTYIMATHPDIQDRLRSEVQNLVARSPEPTSTDIEVLPYLDNFFRESLRMYPPGTTMHRQAIKDLTIQGVFIPEGSSLDMAPAVTSMNPLIWGDDARKVRPDRWDKATNEQLAVWSNNVFSNGPRICIGKAFAQLELKMMLFDIVRHYRFLGVEGSFTVENPALTLRPNGLKIRVEKIT